MYLHQLIVLGRATQDAKLLESKEGKKYASVNIAVNEYLGKNKESKVVYYKALIFTKNSEKAEEVKKGDLLLVEGKPDIDPYISKEGEAKANLVVFTEKWKRIS